MPKTKRVPEREKTGQHGTGIDQTFHLIPKGKRKWGEADVWGKKDRTVGGKAGAV